MALSWKTSAQMKEGKFIRKTTSYCKMMQRHEGNKWNRKTQEHKYLKQLRVPFRNNFSSFWSTGCFISTGDGNILQILKTKWWKYLVMGLADVEANYAVVKAYQFTNLTSIQVQENWRL